MTELLPHPDVIPHGAGLVHLEELVQSDLLDPGAFDDLLHSQKQTEPTVDFVRGPEVPRIRPILVALAARAVGEERASVDLLRTAELLHTALSVHDLALGREGGRRRRVARRLIRRSASWLSGNHLTLRAMELAQASSPHILGDLLHTLREFADGHALMEQLQRGRLPTVADWEEHADTHTGSLFSFCCRVGASPTHDRALEEGLARYGRHLGRAWHIAEDLSVFQHDDLEQAILARTLAGRPMLPVAAAVQLSPGVGRLWYQLLQHPTEATAAWLATMAGEVGGVHAAKERLVTESWHARLALKKLPTSRYKKALEDLAMGIAKASIASR